MINKRIKAVVFDVGGVITEWRKPMNDFFQQYGLEEKDWLAPAMIDEPAGNRGEISMDEYCRRTMRRLGKPNDWKKVRQIFPGGFTLIESTIELLVELKPLIPLAMLTNAMRGSVQELDKKLNFKHYFQVIVDSSEVGMVKPEQEIFQYVCRQLNLEPNQCLFIDDEKPNIEMAEKLGFKTIHFKEPKESVKLIRKILYGKI